MKTIDITAVAVLRPKIVKKCLSAAHRYLIEPYSPYYRFRAFVNVDPIGEEKVSQEKIVAIFREYFDEIKYFTPQKPSFSQAVQRVWSSSQSEVVFHLEDSKMLTREVPLKKAVDAFSTLPKLASISLPPLKDEDTQVIDYEWNESTGLYLSSFFQKAATLQPAFFRNTYISELANFFQEGVDPEKTIRGLNKYHSDYEAEKIQAINAQHYFGFFEREYEIKEYPFINIGRRWRALHGLTKEKGGILNTWVRPTQSKASRKKYFKLIKEVIGDETSRLIQNVKRKVSKK